MVALPDFSRPVPCAALSKFFRFMRTFNARVVLFNRMDFIVNKNARLLYGAGQGIFMLFIVWGGLLLLFKA